MNEQRADDTLLSLGHALDRLGEALDVPLSNPLAVDGTIQRFEFTIELFWKSLKRLLLLEKIETSSPKDVMKKAYAMGWFKDVDRWLEMLDDRNAASHVYRESQAREIYDHVRVNYSELRRTYETLAQWRSSR